MRIGTGTGWPCFHTYNSELGRSSPYWLQYATLHVCHINNFSKFPDISVFYVCEKAGTSRQCTVCFLFLFAVYLKMFKQSIERVTGSVYKGFMKSFIWGSPSISWVKYRIAECQVFFFPETSLLCEGWQMVFQKPRISHNFRWILWVLRSRL